MANFHELAYFPQDTLTLHIAGHTYTIPAASVDTGAKMQAVLAATTAITNQTPLSENTTTTLQKVDEGFVKEVLGPVYDQASQNGLGFKALTHMALTMSIYTVLGDETAATFWNSIITKGSEPTVTTHSPEVTHGPERRHPLRDHRTGQFQA